MKKLFWPVLILLIVLLAFDLFLLFYQHQRANPPAGPDLSGTWNGDGMQAEINGDSIRVYWLNDNGEHALYWAGTYEAPERKGKYSWTSEAYTNETEYALLATKAEDKVFNYDGKILSCEVSVMGVTRIQQFRK